MNEFPKDYRIGFEELLGDFEENLSPKDYKNLKKKFGLHLHIFNLKAFIQAAVETTIVRHFMLNHNTNFWYESSINPQSNMNIECQVIFQGRVFNIEVKTASYDKKEEIEDADGFKIMADGRYDNFNEVYDSLSKVFSNSAGKEGKPPKLLTEKRMDNNLKDFLLSSNEKLFENYPLEHLNVLFIGCADSMDMQQFDNYLVAPRGFFSNNPYIDPEKYSNVDVVVLTNLYYNHSPRYNRRTKNSWNLSSSFCIAFSNPYTKKNQPDIFNMLLSLFPNYTIKYLNYYNDFIRKKISNDFTSTFHTQGIR